MADFLEDPGNLGLLSLGLRLMSTPGKFGSALGTSGLGAIGDMQQAKAAQQAARTRALQEQQMQMQLEELKRAQAEKQKQAERQQMDESTMTRLLGMPFENRQSMADMGPGVPMANRGVDPMAFLNQGGSIGGLGGVLGLNQALAPVSKKPIVSKPGDIARDESGAVLWQNPDAPSKDATDKDVDLLRLRFGDGTPAFMRALDELVKKRTTHAPAASLNASFGTPVAAIGPDGKPVYVQPTKDGSPPNIIPGVRPPLTSGEERSAAEQATRSRQGQQMAQAMDQAEAILKAGRATASGAGTVADAAARAVGISTIGAQDSARLEALSGWLVANVPRMEGPQSNFDVQNYMTMAGKIGDSRVPIKERMAAMQTVRTLQNKYADINGTPSKATSGGAKFLGFE